MYIKGPKPVRTIGGTIGDPRATGTKVDNKRCYMLQDLHVAALRATRKWQFTTGLIMGISFPLIPIAH